MGRCSLLILLFLLFILSYKCTQWMKNPKLVQEKLLSKIGRENRDNILRFLGYLGLPWWLKWLRIFLQCERPRFNPWVRKIPWRRDYLATPVFLPGEFHGQRLQPMGSQRVRYLTEKNYLFIVLDKINSFFTSVTYVFHRNFVLLTMEINKTWITNNAK